MFDPENIVSMVEGLKELDFEKAPSIIFIAKLRDNLRLRGYSKDLANEIVLSMNVELGNENSFSDEQMDRMVDAYGQLVANASAALVAKGFPESAVKTLAPKFSLKLS